MPTLASIKANQQAIGNWGKNNIFFTVFCYNNQQLGRPSEHYFRLTMMVQLLAMQLRP